MDAPERQTLGRYELIQRLGRGAATEAFRAKSFGVEGFEKTIVVKRLLMDVATDENFVAAFLEHVQRAMRLSHANLAQVFDLGRAAEPLPTGYFIATEYVAGLDVATLLDRSRAAGHELPVPLAVYMALEVTKAIDHAHRRRDEELRPLAITHGAIAPHAVLVSFDGDVKLTDFGVTRALLVLPRQRESLRRNFAALSPEQAAGADPSIAGDVFSLGLFLYTLLSGAPPFLEETAEETLRSVVRAHVPPLGQRRTDVPEPVAELVHRALSADPEERFSSASAFHEELLACSYACGLRAGAGELASFVERYREPPPTVPSEVIDELLSRPLTLPPAPPDTVPDDSLLPRLTSVPPLTGFGEMRHLSVLVFAPGSEETPDLARRVAEIVERYGGTLAKLEGADTTALFGLDRSDGRDLERAVRCGLVLARTFDMGQVRAGVGIDAGHLRLGPGREPTNDARTRSLVESAQGLASERERAVLVSRRAAASLRGRFPLEPTRTGLRVSEFAQDRFTDSFVGRKDPIRTLGETLVRAARGELQTVRVQGEPGVGKTRLAVEMQRRLARGSVELGTHFATCPPRGRELPDSGLLAMLRRVCGVHDGDPPERIEALAPRLRALGMSIDETVAVLTELGRAAPQGKVPASTALRSAFIRLLQSLSEDRFTVFVWDDAHELDAASCDVLARAATRLSGSRLALVLSGRPDAGAPYEALKADVEVRLGELDAAEVERLIAERAGLDEVPPELVRFLRERASGQPMFVEELLRQLLDSRRVVVEARRVASMALDEGIPVPRTLRALTADRLGRLEDDEKHLFVAAAVLEPPADIEVLARMVEMPFVAVEQIAASLSAQGLLGREGAAKLGFASPLAREVVLAELDPKDLESLHRRAAAALTDVLGARAQVEGADQIGYHLAAAGDRDGAAEHYAQSGLSYLAARKLDRAAQSLVYALDLARLETRTAEQIGNWLGALSTAVRYVRAGPGFPALIDRVTERAVAEDREPLLGARMRIDLASIQGSLGQELAGEALLDASAEQARGRPELAMSLLSTYADLTSGRGDFRAARRALDPLARMTLTDRQELHKTTLAMARTLAAAGKADAAAAAFEDAVKVAAKEDALLALERAAVRTSLQTAVGDFRSAAESAAQAAAQAEELGLLYEVASSLSEQAAALARLGDTAHAYAAVTSAMAGAEEIAAERIILRCRLVLSYLEGATPDAMRGDIAQLESRGWIGDALLGRHFLGLLAARLGDRELAVSELSLASRIAAKAGNQSMADQCDAEIAKLG